MSNPPGAGEGRFAGSDVTLDAELPGPWFVGCHPNECEGRVFGPLWAYEHAQAEARSAADDSGGNPCPHAHLIGRYVSDRVRVERAPVYIYGVCGTEADAEKTTDWHRRRNERVGSSFLDPARVA